MHNRPIPATQVCVLICIQTMVSYSAFYLRTYLHDSTTGLQSINMAEAISTNQIEEYPTVTADRSSIHAINFPGSNRSAFSKPLNLWDTHGLILSFSVILNCLGILLIRSGFKWAFHGHWIVQALSALGLLTGCLIGVLKSTHVFQVRNIIP